MTMINRNKSNLHIKQHTKRKIFQNTESKLRRETERNLLEGANIIFGLDNGTTGTMSCIIPNKQYIDIIETPVIEAFDYTQEVQRMNRIDFITLKNWFEKHLNFAKNIYKKKIKPIVILERPMVNPQRFKQSRICFKSV